MGMGIRDKRLSQPPQTDYGICGNLDCWIPNKRIPADRIKKPVDSRSRSGVKGTGKVDASGNGRQEKEHKPKKKTRLRKRSRAKKSE